MLKITELCYRYPGGPDLLKSVNFELEPGTFLAILGNNGAGKSTLIKCFSKIIFPNNGSIRMDGEELLHMSCMELAKRVALVSQSVPSTRMTVHDMVMLGRRPYMHWRFTEQDHRIVHEAMDRLGLSPIRGRYLDELSGGERQKVMFARALAQQPRVMLLDEPTSSLDLCNQYRVLSLMRQICHEEGITAMMVIHDLNLALRFCDLFLLLHGGTVFRFGGPEILDREALRQVYGLSGDVKDVDGVKMVAVDL
ncbi:ABC transporter ATP-binding protein [Clostridium sp. AF18-27]|uniref:ABC transporter ATP-binding protein n=1 Tax=Enterocloster lavalensis TaxID=460384 RepID=UPI000E53D3FF|nr:ABC transporter ATP-binding protein [Enterocloster lavalensis]MBS5604670.1 ABC transporter ATP-binding protein [Enterocloster asparagiformis]RHR49087.1 ABC transporter ATP-binding protein [Clostridium sp. AF18-27]